MDQEQDVRKHRVVQWFTFNPTDPLPHRLYLANGGVIEFSGEGEPWQGVVHVWDEVEGRFSPLDGGAERN